MKKLPLWLGYLVAAILSLGAAFFVVFNVIFSDIFGMSAQIGAVIYVLVVYAVISIFLHWLWRGTNSWLWWLITPALFFALTISLQERVAYVYELAVMAAAIGGTLVGKAIFGRRQLTTT